MKIQKERKKSIRLPEVSMRFRLLLYSATMILGILSVTETYRHYFIYAADIIVHVASACGIFISVCYLRRDISYGIRRKVKPAIESHSFTYRIYKDYRYRTVLSARAFCVNIFFAVSNGIYGCISRSVWLGTLAAYYVFLSIMRFSTVWYEKKIVKFRDDQNTQAQELKAYGFCGLLLIFITVALGGAVILLIREEGGKSYPGTLIFAVAAYTFYKIAVSVIHMVKAAKMKSLLLVTIRNIGYADALVSLLSLQTAMLCSFGEGNDMDSRMVNGMTGAAICIMILAIGIYMTYSADKGIKELRK